MDAPVDSSSPTSLEVDAHAPAADGHSHGAAIERTLSPGTNAIFAAAPPAPVLRPLKAVSNDSRGQTATDLDHVKGAFLASLNHEIRTPLSGIMGMVDLLLETKLDEDQREYVSATRSCAENLFELLNATLEYSAMEAGQVTLDEGEFSIREMIDATISQFQTKAEAKHLKLFQTLDAGLPETLVGDALRFREMLGYLITNAIKFTNAGSVELRASLRKLQLGPQGDGGAIQFEVRDTGIGIASDKLETIFESFRQGESGLSRNYPGLGLGLSLARKLAAMMGGRIGIESQPGVGSVFSVVLPVRPPTHAAPTPAEGAAQSEARARVPEQGAPFVLAVEDNPVGLMVLRHLLERRHLRVECAVNGQDAVAAASRRRYDLILMDLQMPGMDGLTASDEIRKLPGYQRVPIVALTANFSDQVRRECLAHGMRAFLSKPVEAGELWSTVSRCLKRD